MPHCENRLKSITRDPDCISLSNSRLWGMVFRLNINGRDVQRKNVVNNVDKSSLWAPRVCPPPPGGPNIDRCIKRLNNAKQLMRFNSLLLKLRIGSHWRPGSGLPGFSKTPQCVTCYNNCPKKKNILLFFFLILTLFNYNIPVQLLKNRLLKCILFCFL